MPIHNHIAVIPVGTGFAPFRDALAIQGPIVGVQIEVPLALAEQLQKTGQPIPAPAVGVALIDTGAGVSGIDTTVINQLQVQPVGQQMIGGVTGAKMRSKYPARFTFPGTSLPGMNFGELVEAEISNFVIPGATGPLIALIGRDIPHHFVLIYNGPNGTFTLSC